ncbi:MAG: hypothetical protein WD598_06380 [Acidimicrobiia bacterium]
MSARVGLLVFVLVLGLAACTDSGIEDACSLLTDDEAEAVLGEPTREGVLDTDRTISGTFCEWLAQSSSTRESDNAYELYIEERPAKDALDDFEDDRKDLAEEIDGLGDEAFLAEDGNVHIRTDDLIVLIGVSTDDRHDVGRAAQAAIARAAAELVAERLP